MHLATIVLLGVGLLSAPKVRAQEVLQKSKNTDFARNSIFVELLGNGGIYTLNYDHKFFNHVSARIGAEYVSLTGSDTNIEDRVSIFLLPVMINYLVGNGNSRLELGAGAILGGVNANVDNETVNGIGGGSFTGTVGYRLQPRDGGFLFRIGFTPIVSSLGFYSWAGLSLGATF